MGRKRKPTDPEIVRARKEELIRLAAEKGVVVHQYGHEGRHMRIVGQSSIDYWPSTMTAWPTERFDLASLKLTPSEVVMKAQQSLPAPRDRSDE